MNYEIRYVDWVTNDQSRNANSMGYLLPLVYTMLIHRSQELVLDNAVVDIGCDNNFTLSFSIFNCEINSHLD